MTYKSDTTGRYTHIYTHMYIFMIIFLFNTVANICDTQNCTTLLTETRNLSALIFIAQSFRSSIKEIKLYIYVIYYLFASNHMEMCFRMFKTIDKILDIKIDYQLFETLI